MLALPDEQFGLDEFLASSASLSSPGNRQPIVLDKTIAETISKTELDKLTHLVEKLVKIEEKITVTEAALVQRVLAFKKPT